VSATYQVPFLAGRTDLLGSIFGGWQINGIVTAQSGLPVGTTAGAVLVSDPSIDNPTMARWFNTCTQALSGARQNCASADEPVAWSIQAPFTLRTVLQLAVTTVVPVVPLALTMISVEELLVRLLKLVF